MYAVCSVGRPCRFASPPASPRAVWGQHGTDMVWFSFGLVVTNRKLGDDRKSSFSQPLPPPPPPPPPPPLSPQPTTTTLPPPSPPPSSTVIHGRGSLHLVARHAGRDHVAA